MGKTYRANSENGYQKKHHKWEERESNRRACIKRKFEAVTQEVLPEEGPSPLVIARRLLDQNFNTEKIIKVLCARFNMNYDQAKETLQTANH